MKQNIQRTIIAIVAVMLLAPVAVSAEENSGSTSTGTGDSSTATPKPSTTPSPETIRKYKEQLNTQLQQLKSERKDAVANTGTDAKKPLNDARKKVCEKHQAQIDTVMSNMNKRRQDAYDKITKAYDTVQKYYMNHNLSITGYSDLVAKADAAQAAAQSTMTTQIAVPAFKCDSSHPLADVGDFKEKRADSIDAMKAYRDAVRAIVKAVKAVAPAESASPSASPVATKEDQ